MLACQVPRNPTFFFFYIMLIIVYIGCVIGKFVTKDVPTTTTAFTYACLTLSSTPLVIKFLQQNKDKEISADSECGSIILGMLVMQDVQLGFIIAILPALAKQTVNGEAASSMGIFSLIFELLGSIVIVFLVAFLFSKFIICRLMKFLQKNPKELQVLGSGGVMYICLLFTRSMGLSMELGCFLAGIIISTSASSYKENVIHVLEPLNIRVEVTRLIEQVFYLGPEVSKKLK